MLRKLSLTLTLRGDGRVSSSFTVHHRSKDDSDRTRETLTDVEEIYAAVQFAVSRL